MLEMKQWDANPIAAFTAFVRSAEFTSLTRRLGEPSGEPVSEKSAEVYGFMFAKFISWLRTENRTFTQAEEKDLIRFVSQLRRRREQNSAITERYLRLLERCYQHLEIAPNPATSAMKLAGENKYLAKNKATEALRPEQIDAFVAALPFWETDPRNRAGRLPKGWKRRRDHAVQATMLFGGLRVAEVIGLHLSEVDDVFGHGPIRIQITPEDKHDTSYEHDTLVQGYGAERLREWLIERKAENRAGERVLAGDLVFPGDQTGKPMSKVTLWRQVRNSFERAKIEVDRSGGRTLRNTFAVKQLVDGGSTADLQKSLGLALERSTETYKVAKAKKERES
jgi:integrase/recombinase XerD